MPNFTLGRFSFHRQIYFLAFSDCLPVEKKTGQSGRFRVLSLEVVASVPKSVFCLFVQICQTSTKICQTRYFLIGGPLAFRLFKPIVNDDYHQEHKEFWWRVSLSHFSLWNEEEKAFCVCGISFCVSFFCSDESSSVRSRNCSLKIKKLFKL